MEGRATRAVLAAWSIGVVLFLLLPIATIVLFAFDRSNVQSWPISHYTLKMVLHCLERPAGSLGILPVAQGRGGGDDPVAPSRLSRRLWGAPVPLLR